MREMDHGRPSAPGRGGTTAAGERDAPAPGASIPVLLLPENVLVDGLDAALLTIPEFDPDADLDRPVGLLHRVAAAVGRVWHRQWEF
jgi:hypothetical protein